MDEANDLATLCATFAGTGPERIHFVFAEGATYLAEYNNMTYNGRDAIVNQLKFIAEEIDDKRFAYLATIDSVDEGNEPLPYGAGKRCIVIAYGDEHRYMEIAFADIDEEGASPSW